MTSKFDHPIIDAEAHHLEFLPKLDEYLREGMGSRLFQDWLRKQGSAALSQMKRKALRLAQPGWWTATPATHAIDRAAAAAPQLMQERMERMGIDYMILYTSVGLGTLIEPNEEMRRTFCSSLNKFYADHYLSFQQRLTPVGVIPMYTPHEALTELDHCHSLGLKVVQLPHGIPRPIPAVHALSPDLYPSIHWLDTFGVDSEFDYDPVWRRLVDLGFAATFHGHSAHGAALKSSRSVTNYVFNHIGAHAGLMCELCKSLLIGGVTFRFKNLPFAFLEGGVYWACALLNHFTEHWEKRNASAIQKYDPRKLDVESMKRLLLKWGGKLVAGCSLDDIQGVYANRREGSLGDSAEPVCHDDFAACEIKNRSDVLERFENFFFGCEPDDRMAHLGFQGANPFGAKLRAIFTTDFGHWDAAAAAELLPSNHRLLESGLLSSEDFRAFMADNVINLYGSLNPMFWKGTAIEKYAGTVLKRS